MSDAKITLSRAIKLFLGDKTPNTRRSYQYVLKYMEEYTHVTGFYTLDEIKPDHLIEMIQIVEERQSVQSVETVNKYIKTIKVFFNWCIKCKFIDPPSPAEAVKRRRAPLAVDREKAMPNDQFTKLITRVQFDVRAYALVSFLADSADRIGGAANLQWKDVDLNKRRAVVTEKGQDPRFVFFGEECCAALVRWRTKQGKNEKAYVFSRDGEFTSGDALGQYFTRWCKKAGIGNWGPHSLRHRKAYNAVDEGYPPTTVALMLGHRNVMTTLRSYYPRDWELAREAVEKMSYKPNQRPELPKIFEDKFGTDS